MYKVCACVCVYDGEGGGRSGLVLYLGNFMYKKTQGIRNHSA